MDEHSVILATKMRPPRLGHTMIARDALMARFSSFNARRLTLVSAPTGYGKTTSVCLWLETIDRPYAWLSLDEHDNHLYDFVRYLAAALHSVLPHAPMTIKTCLDCIPMPEPRRLADCFLNDLAALNSPLVIVLDDYHAIANLDVHAFMRRLVTRLAPHIHVVIITRADPPLPLAQLRVQGDLVDIRCNELRFSPSEAAQLLEPHIGFSAPAHVIDRIGRIAEGWPAGIRLAAISLQQTHNSQELIDRLPNKLEHMYIEYLLDELFRELEPPMQLLLARMAIFERISAPLIELVRPEDFNGPSAEEIIAMLWRSNYFLTSLDQDGTWYQLHELVRNFLLQELGRRQSSETICDLHLQAGQWFSQHALHKEAVGHASRCGDESYMIRCAEEVATQAINANNWHDLEVLLGALPKRLNERPHLLIAKAYLHNYLNNYDSAPTLLDAATAGLITNSFGYSAERLQILDGQIQALRAATAVRNGMYEDAARHAERAEKSLPDSMVTERGYARFAHNLALIRLGDGDNIQERIQATLHELDRCQEPHLIRQLMAFSFVLYEDANLWSMRELILQLKPVVYQMGQPLFVGWIDFWSGWIQYQRNALAPAVECFSRVVEKRDSVHTRAYVESATGMALALNALGKPDDAKQAVIDLRAYGMKRGLIDMVLIAESLAVRLSMGNDIIDDNPLALSSCRQTAVKRTNVGLWEWPPATIVRSHLRHGSAVPLTEVDAYLQQCEELVRQVRSKSRTIELAALRAQLSHRRGDEQAALDALRNAVDLAAAGGTLRLIADDADGLDQYFEALRTAGDIPAHIHELYTIVAARAQAQGITDVMSPKQECPSNHVLAQGDALTFRELEVLGYIQQGRSNKEIAKYLTISPSTVRKHTINIYDKLQVANRTQAAAKARQLNLGLPRLSLHGSLAQSVPSGVEQMAAQNGSS